MILYLSFVHGCIIPLPDKSYIEGLVTELDNIPVGYGYSASLIEIKI